MPSAQADARRPFPAAFWGSAGLVAAVCAAIVRTPLFDRAPDMGAFGVTFDLCVTIPVLYYVLVVRRGAHPATLIPIFGVGMVLARLLVPRGHQEFLHSLAPVAAALEIVLLGVVFARARRASRVLRSAEGADPVEKIHLACEGIFGRSRAAGFLSAEIAILWFALFSWRRAAAPAEMRRAAAPAETSRAGVPAETSRRSSSEGVTFYRASGWPTVLAVVFLLIAGEGFGAHVLLSRWSLRAAWTFTALDVYSVLWLLGDFQALRLRPATFDGRVLVLRFGMRWSARIDASNVLSVTRLAPGAFPKAPDTLRFSMLDEPRYAIAFRVPETFRGIAGLERKVRAVGVLPDDSAAFESLFAEFLS